MAKPTYTYGLSGSPLSGGTTVTLPRGPRWGRVKEVTEENIVHRTNRGMVWPYRLVEREVREYIFRFPESEYETFRTFHKNVQGLLTPFYWTYEGVTLLVRKMPGFRPEPVSQEAFWDQGVYAHWYDWKVTLTEESLGLEILA